MADSPNSYRDDTYASLDAATTAKLGLPDGLLENIRTKGERSNADQVSSAGAKTVYQIIPATRDAAVKKYGIDPYLSPENASLVAGMLLKDSLDRNKGSIPDAVGEYIGGTDRNNWGKTTQAYIQRVTGGNGAPPASSGGRSLANELATSSEPEKPSIAKVFEAYQSGKMPDDVAKEFEADVQAGKVLLPRGLQLKETAAPAPVIGTQIPQRVVDAYTAGQMPPDVAAEFQADVQSGKAILPKGVTLPFQSISNQIPTSNGEPYPVVTPQPKPTIGEQLVGAGEAGLNALTGLTGGALGLAGGTIKGLAGSILNGTMGTQEGVRNVEQQAAQGAEALTYQPRTAAGQQQAQTVGEAMQNLIPLAPMAGEMGLLGETAKPAIQAAREQAGAIVAPIRNAGAQAAQRVAAAVRPTPTETAPMAGVGAAATDMAAQRTAAAESLPVPVNLTKGQATRTFEQQRFEQEAAKNPELGQPLRERFAQQNENILKNFDAWVDQTGAEAPNLRAVGQTVDKALVGKAARDKAEIRVAYKNAEKAGEMESPVSVDAIAKLLNDSASAESVAPVLTAAKKEMIRLGGASLDDAGNLVPSEMTLGDAELLRKFVNKTAGADPTNIKYAADIKNAIDASTDGAGGKLYQQARALRSRFANQYENRAVISKLLNTKRGTNDRQVAFEDVYNHAIQQGSLDDVRTVRKVLQTAGPEGQQAWKELQGATVNNLKDLASSNASRDINGNPIVSASKLDRGISALDKDGKLDFIFGKQGAQQLRDINDLAKVIYTSPPGTINSSNTASVLTAALDMALSGSAGMPLPVASGIRLLTKRVKDRALTKRINEALNQKQPQTKNNF